MPIIPADIQYRLSGGAANANPNLSFGGVMSSTAWAGGALHDLFDQISGSENTGSTIDYRCVYVRNNHATLQWQTVLAWLSAEVAGGANIAIGLDPAVAGNGSTTGVAATVANETTAPAGVTFTSPTTKAGGIALGSVNATLGRAIWIRRTATNSAAQSADGFTLSTEGDSAA